MVSRSLTCSVLSIRKRDYMIMCNMSVRVYMCKIQTHKGLTKTFVIISYTVKIVL